MDMISFLETKISIKYKRFVLNHHYTRKIFTFIQIFARNIKRLTCFFYPQKIATFAARLSYST
ncbi:hypothetical protein Tanf_04970 [Tannerella forsythia]|uniref:Uncharacterized protein n=1 Tax=Tannerella forsythia TaxID=28112 RepID=A0A2A6E8T9_TANFO|nr:hypothetical protein Tanf_04970 [Tannerella forsythia]OLQ21435.1 hypothetical protein BGK60_07990 [Tannerella forsythia]PDP44004.1 hypothetical protein CLI86_05660 [Tannerella forsythia]